MVKDLICLQRHIDVVLWETFLEFICRYSQEGASDDDAPNLVSPESNTFRDRGETFWVHVKEKFVKLLNHKGS